MPKFEIWSEGYVITGNTGEAEYHGKFEGKTFKDAVAVWKNTLDTQRKSCVDTENLTFWGCRLFDNELDARKSFG